MKRNVWLVAFSLFLVGAFGGHGATLAQDEGTLMWINHLDFLPGDPSVIVSFNPVDSGVGSGLSGLIIESTTTGEVGQEGGDKLIEKALLVPPGYLVNGVRVCYELFSSTSFISGIRLTQVQDPSQDAALLLNDDTDLADGGPVCTDSSAPSLGPINPSEGPLLLSLKVNFGDTNDRIVLRGVGLKLVPDPESLPVQELLEQLQQQIDELREDLANHSHTYLTGRGKGHNNTLAITGPASFSESPPPEPEPWKPSKGKGKGRKK